MMIVKKMDALSLAKIEAIIGVIVGLIAGIFVGIFSSIMGAMLNVVESAAVAGSAGELSPITSTGFFALGWLAVIVMPIAYGIMFFIAGLIGAWIYNLAAKFVGGIKMEVEYEQVQTTTTQQPVQQQTIRK